MTRSRKKDPRNSKFCPVGELTVYTAAANKSRLMEALAGAEGLELDLAQVSEIDTAGVQLLILAKLESYRSNIPFRIVGQSDAVREVLDLYNMVSFFARDFARSTSESEAGAGA